MHVVFQFLEERKGRGDKGKTIAYVGVLVSDGFWFTSLYIFQRSRGLLDDTGCN